MCRNRNFLCYVYKNCPGLPFYNLFGHILKFVLLLSGISIENYLRQDKKYSKLLASSVNIKLKSNLKWIEIKQLSFLNTSDDLLRKSFDFFSFRHILYFKMVFFKVFKTIIFNFNYWSIKRYRIQEWEINSF